MADQWDIPIKKDPNAAKHFPQHKTSEKSGNSQIFLSNKPKDQEN